MDNQNIDRHIFAKPDFLSSKNYPTGTTVKVKVQAFLGRRDYKNWDNEIERSGFYRVLHEGREIELRLNDTNEDELNRKFGITDYPQIVGRLLSLQVATRTKKSPITYWTVVGLESPLPKPQVPPQPPKPVKPQ